MVSVSRDRKRREEAKRHEREGRVEEAVRAFLAAGSFSDAVRVYADAERPLDAAALIMRVVKVAPDEVGELKGEKRRLARKAGRLFEKGGKMLEAAAIEAALNDEDPLEDVASSARVSVVPDSRRVRQSSPGRTPTGPRVSPRSVQAPTSSPSPTSSQPSSSSAARESVPHPPDSHPRSKKARRIRRSVPDLSDPSPRSSPSPRSDPARASKPSLGRASARDLATRLEARGDFRLAKTAFLGLGSPADAARVAEKMKEPREAARLFGEAKMHEDAARCFIDAKDQKAALQALMLIEPDHVAYRRSCARAIDLATELAQLDLELYGFVRRYVLGGVAGTGEVETFYKLGRLYEANDHESSALEAYAQLEAFDPLYRDVAARVLAIESGTRVGSGEKIVGDATSYSTVNRDRASHDRLPRSPVTSRRKSSGMVPRSDPPPADSLPPEFEELAAKLSAGDIVGNRYRVKRHLGEGGMAEVYEVLDQELGAIIALKLFTTEVNSPALLARCRRELMLARELNHDNIVRVFDIGLHGERRFITMEMLDGADLRDVMDEAQPTWGESLRYLVQACDGLHAAHLRGVVHRDVKPENFFVTKNDQLKVMDFGIAKKATDTDEIVIDGTTAGTPAYMSPEQIRDYSSVSPMADVYSLGVMAFEMVTGEVPFYTDDARELMMMHIKEPPPPPTILEPDLPAALEEIVLHALEKSVDKRLKTCREMSDRLQEVLKTFDS
jgi:eukaryotic-like serine/threonine-protein kinase